MAPLTFSSALRFVLLWEGGYVDHPADPGGRTNKGVTQAVYDRWRDARALERRHVRLIEGAEVEAIYEAGYWVPARCEILLARLDLVQFDTAVNMGPSRAVRLLQAALGCGVDGAFGPLTERAAAGCDVDGTVGAYCDARLGYYRRLVERRPELGVFLKGWGNRVRALRGAAGPAGAESATTVDFGDAAYIARVPDLGVDPAYDIDD